MKNHNCIFCKIIKKEAPSTLIKETPTIIVIKTIAPQAPIHYLIIPKKHIENLLYLTNEDQALSFEILVLARDLGKSLSRPAFNLIANNGTASGQTVPHLHFHFLAETSIEKIVGKEL